MDPHRIPPSLLQRGPGIFHNSTLQSTTLGTTTKAGMGSSIANSTLKSNTSSAPNHAILSSDNQDDEDEDEGSKVVETDPTGRFERFAVSLGTGAYKEVFKAFDQEEGVEVAWNQLKLDHLSRRDIPRILSEIRILESLVNDNIINFFHSWSAKGPDGKERVFFITELMTSGTLKGYIRRTKGPVKPKVLKNWCRQILSGLAYLHSRNPPIIHRDLKCDNIFINGNNGQAKIGDLGLAIVKHTEHVSSVLGTPEFLAPEVYDEKYDEKVDIYAFGMVVLEIVIKEYPYSECSNQAQIYKKVTSGIRPLGLQKVQDEDTRQFIELCLTFDPRRRPAAADLLQHSYLAFTGEYAPSSSINLFDGMSASQSAEHLGSVNSGTSLPPDSVTSSPTEDRPATFDSLLRNNLTQSSAGSSIQDSPNPTVVDAENHTFLISERPRLRSIATDSDTYCVVECKERPSEDEVTLKMLYGITGGPVTEIVFPFKLSEDTATDVVSEMIKENLIDEHDEQLTRRKLEEAVRIVLLGQIRSTSVELLSRKGSPSSSPTLIASQRLAPSFMEPLASQTAPISIIAQPSRLPEEPQPYPVTAPSAPLHHSVGSPSSNYSRSPATHANVSVPFDAIPTMEPLPRPMMIPSYPTQAPSITTQDPQLTLVGSPLHKAASFVDPAVQSKLQELQEINLKGLGSLELNASLNHSGPRPAVTQQQRTVSRTSSYSNFGEQWPLTFGNSMGTSVSSASSSASSTVHTLSMPLSASPNQRQTFPVRLERIRE